MEIAIKGYTINPNPLYVGTHSLIYSGTRNSDHENIVIKLLNNEYPSADDLLHIKHEYEIAKLFTLEKNIVQVYALEQLGNSYGIIMENITMPTLARWIERKKINLSIFLELALQMTNALATIHHKNIIHKDINPSNILCDIYQKRLTVIDLGLSANLPKEHVQIVNPNVLEGSLSYLSPEQTGRMNRGIDYRTDFYSLGVTFYQMLTGTLPFDKKDPLELVHSHIAIVPPSPQEVNPEIPTIISNIVMKLLSKKAEDRYQNANGLIADLKNCQKQLFATDKIDSFPLAQEDIFSRFLISEKIYGRSEEINTLLSSYEEVVNGNIELMLIAGYSGIGKTSLVQEIHKPIVAQQGYFVSGKFDQFKHTIPYVAITEAFGELVKQILGESENRIKYFRAKILDAVGPYGKLITEIIPNLTSIIGEQPDVPETGPTERLNILSHIFQNFIVALCTKEHPLVLFLDDLQWADSASLKMLETLLTGVDAEYLFIIGAYRSNEVSASHPLTATIEELNKKNVKMKSINLGPIASNDTTDLLADTLHREKDIIQPLAILIHEKTKGNPFFIIQLIHSLYKDGSIYFDKTNTWSWNINSIKEKHITDNVIDLMVNKIKDLPVNTQNILQYCACIGNQFNLELLGFIIKKEHQTVLADLQAGLEEGYIISEGESYRAICYYFAHDRIQQAAYSFIADSEKKHIHLELARLLSKQTPDAFFNIVDHYNHALDIAKEKLQIAELNLKASITAKDAAAFEPAFEYIETALKCVDDSLWKTNYKLMFSLFDQAAKCSLLCGKHDLTENYAKIALEHAQSNLDKLKITQTQIFSSVAQLKQSTAVDLAINILAENNIKLPRKPKLYHVLYYVFQTKWLLRNKSTTDILNSPEMQDETKKLIIPLISSVFSSAYQSEQPLFAILICVAVQLSVRYGNTQTSAVAYSCFGIVLCGVLGEIEKGYAFGQLALNLIEKLKDEESRTRSNFINQYFIKHWKEPIHEIENLSLEYFVSGIDHGDLEYASYNIMSYVYQSFQSGTPLQHILINIDKYKHLVKQYGQVTAYNYICVVHQAVLNMIQLKEKQPPALLVGDGYDEHEVVPQLMKANDRSGLCFNFSVKVMMHYLFDELPEALEHIKQTDKYIDAQVAQFAFATFYFYKALTLLALYPNFSFFKKMRVIITIKSLIKQFAAWTKFTPENHLHRYILLKAEYANHVKKNIRQAAFLYDEAIETAKDNKFLLDQALANELAAKFYLAQGHKRIAGTYIKDAHYCYHIWGAVAKVAYLDQHYKIFLSRQATTTNRSTATGTEILDWETIQKSSLALSSTIFLNKLLKRLMQLVIENAGAQKSYVLLKKGKQFYIEAEKSSDDKDTKMLESIPLNAEQLPLNVVNYVIHTKETLVLDNAMHSEQFRQDTYIASNQVKSILCMPLLNQGQLTGILYLENNLIEGAFTQNNVKSLTLLSSQISMSIKNAVLYQRTQELNERLIVLVHSYELFVPKDFLSLLNKESIEIVKLGDHVQAKMTVIFIDIRNFTTRSEAMTPTDNFKFINHFLNIVAPLIRQYHGFVDKYIGDGVMALFPHNVDDAVDCALAAQKAVMDYNKKHADQESIAIGIGMNTGLVMLGIVGEEHRMNATVISDAVNTASRVESLTKQYKIDILITEDTYNSLANPAKYSIEKVGTTDVKGKKKKITIYGVDWKK